MKESFSRLMQFAAPHKKKFLCSVIVAVTGVACGLIPYFTVAKMLNLIMNGERDFRVYLVWCLMAGIAFIAKSILMGVSTHASHQATFAVLTEIRRSLAEKLTRVSMGYLTDTPSGKLKSMMVERVEQMEIPLAHIIPELTANLLVPIGIILYLFTIDWRMALASLITIPLGMLCYMGQMRTYPKMYGAVVQAGKHMSATTVEYINGIEVIKAFNQSAASYQRFADAVRTNTDLYLAWMKSTQGYSALMMSVWPAVLVGVLPVGCLLYAGGGLAGQDFVTMIILSLGIIGPLVAAIFLTDEFSKISTIVGEICSVLDESDLERPVQKAELTDLHISLQNVTFAYRDIPVLKGVSLEIKPGSTVALVGASGSGKSTIAKLIASYWDVDGGCIKIGGKDIRQLPAEQIIDQIGYVSQDNFLFNDTVRNNIAMGNPDALAAEVEAMAKAAGCHDFIINLENGYDTIVGGAGGFLSGGERQRIAIARAMMKDAPIVILDEATSYTDPENELVIQEAVRNLTKNKTLIVIAHRLSTITDADQIAVVDQGVIAAAGRHDQLLINCPLYRQMWEAHIQVKDTDKGGETSA